MIVILPLVTEKSKFILKNLRTFKYLAIYLLILSLSHISPIKKSCISMGN